MKTVTDRPILRFLICIALCEGVGLFGAIFTIQSIPTWYAGLQKPWFTPPSLLFGPAWTTLYALMGVSLFIIWNIHREYGRLSGSIFLFGFQLVLNALWSFIFFGLQLLLVAFVEILILWILILFTALNFWKWSKLAAILLVPYLAWVSFASLLNFYVWRLN